MKVFIKTDCQVGGDVVRKGETPILQEAAAKELISYGLAERFDAKKHTPAPTAAAISLEGDGDTIDLTPEGLKALPRAEQEKLATELGVKFDRRTKEDELIAKIIEASEQAE